MDIYHRQAMVIIRRLPKGYILKASQILKLFLITEKETLRKWYNGMQLQLLDEADYLHLFKRKQAALNFGLLIKKGMDKTCVVALKQELLELLKENALLCSGVYDTGERTRYKVRLYKLPEKPLLLSNWNVDEAQYLPN
ncbi:hypothetical protein [Pedobacter alpinus]|uniref:Uncharacterized protein n=1 Tax=Pedobacter alpinus TaxID=1590643 RepID=A0ABW5TSK1_9SPHI